jgi:hypothetical protein
MAEVILVPSSSSRLSLFKRLHSPIINLIYKKAIVLIISRFENPSLPPSFDRLRMVSMPNSFPKGGDISFPLWKTDPYP